MNQKEISEIRRRINLKSTNINHIFGWYVNTNGEVITSFQESVGLMNENLGEQYLSRLKKVLSGTLGKNLIDMEFTTAQVESSSEHSLLMSLRKTRLEDGAIRDSFIQKIVESLKMEEKYLILMACDSYDVPYRGGDGEVFREGSEEVFTYVLCAICPVKDGKPILRFNAREKSFENYGESAVGSPEIGFMFPAFDDRRGNIYDALFYTRNPFLVHQELVDAILGIEPPMLQPQQKERFEEALAEAMEGPCEYEVLQSIHEKVWERVAEYKESKEPEPLVMTTGDLEGLLKNSGVEPEKLEVFRKKFDDEFGESARLSPTNIIESKKFVVNTADVVINVKPEKSYLVEAGTVEGRKYIMVNAEEGVEVNGINAKI